MAIFFQSYQVVPLEPYAVSSIFLININITQFDKKLLVDAQLIQLFDVGDVFFLQI